MVKTPPLPKLHQSSSVIRRNNLPTQTSRNQRMKKTNRKIKSDGKTGHGMRGE
jgi:hypothetical protein